jgi:hypothetical protein
MVKIICEGKTDKNKISELLTFLNISYSDDNFNVMGNKSNIFKKDDIRYTTLLKFIKSDKIEQVLFIVDTDYQKDNNIYGGYDNTKNEIEKLLINLKIENISDYYITCNPITKDGYLESLLLSTVDDNLKICYDKFLDCIDFKEKNQHKYIMEQLHKMTQPNKPYDFNHKNFNELKEKLTNLFEI